MDGLSAAAARLGSICILTALPQTCMNSAGSFFYLNQKKTFIRDFKASKPKIIDDLFTILS
jgi:hypothetical protein